MSGEGWLERDAVRLHYVEWQPEGEVREPAILLLHGLSANALYWSRLAQRFPRRRLVALDQRSHGHSDRPPAGTGAYTRDQLVADAAHAMSELDMRRPVVLGHSWGAAVALDLAATHPQLVSGLGHVDGPIGPMSERLSWDDASRLMQPPLPVFATRADAREHIRPWLKEAWGDDLQEFAEAGTMARDDAWVLTLTGPVRLEILQELYEFQPQLLWPGLAVPALVAVASGDPAMLTWKKQGVELVESLLPEVEVRWYDSAHDIPLIQPDRLAQDVERLCLRAAWRALADDITSLDGDWDLPVPKSTWTARDLLAHLSSTVTSLPRVLAEPQPTAGGSSEPFDSDRWNAAQVTRRQDHTAEQLRDELAQATAALEAGIVSADFSVYAGIGPYAGMPLGDVMEEMLAHQRGHLAELRAALGR
jgi:pimeloyl-ACP methyl ester carboxylesterase